MALNCQKFVFAQCLEYALIPRFVYALMLTRSGLGFLHLNFFQFIIELRPVIDVKILFLLNILSTN